MKGPRWALLAALAWAAALAPCAGQLEVRGNIIGGGGGGGGLVFSESGTGRAQPEVDPAGPHVLEFSNGHQLRGTMESLDIERGRVAWKRPDVSAPLTLPLAQIRRLTLDNKPKTDPAPLATIKLAGSDWLNATVTSIDGDKIHLRLPDGARLTIERAHVEWIYFSESGGGMECYDGPISMAGWTSSGGWRYHDGALRALSPTAIQRQFQKLPDRVEYRMTVDQGKLSSAFTVLLHNSAQSNSNRRTLQLMVRANSLSLWGPVSGDYKSQQVDGLQVPGVPGGFGRGPVQFRLFEDVTAGRVVLFLNGKRKAEWKIDPAEKGKNGGGFQFQSNSWSGQEEQSISKIQVLPWDGREPDEEQETSGDRVSLADGKVFEGKVRSADEGTLKLESAGAPISVPREKIRMLRWSRSQNPTDEDPPMATVRIVRGGSFDVVAVNWRGGKLVVRTNFGGELSIVPEDLAELEFRREASPALPPADVLVFKNGDRLRGSLRAASEAGQLRWETNAEDGAAEFTPNLLAGIQFAAEVPALPGNVTARFRNGDSWTAGFVTLDRESLVLDTAEVGQITLPRAALKALYFNPANEFAVSEATADHELWERGLDMNVVSSMISTTRPRPANTTSPWKYLAGSYSWGNSGTGTSSTRSGSANLGRLFEALPARAEIAFTVSSQRSSLYFSAQLFTEPGNPGYMVHLSGMGISFYDMNPKNRARGVFQQQFQFGKEITPEARQRRVHFLADRTSGRLAIVVDGVLVGQVNPRAAEGPRNLGRGLMIVPQPSIPCTFSDIWVGPWNGQIPKRSGGEEAAPETVVLANGDEAQGTVELATPTTMKLASDVGSLDLPVERITMLDFGGAPIERPVGTRLQLTGLGSLSVKQWRVEDETMILQSTIAGELRLPLNRVQEIVFAPADSPATPKPTPP